MINLKRSLREQPDIHARLMSRYQQVPEWHYIAIFGEKVDYYSKGFTDRVCLFLLIRYVSYALLVRLRRHTLDALSQPRSTRRLLRPTPYLPRSISSCFCKLAVVTFIFACVCIEVWPSGMTIWALLVALIICEHLFPYPLAQNLTTTALSQPSSTSSPSA